MSDFYVGESEIFCLFRTLFDVFVVAKSVCKTGKNLKSLDTFKTNISTLTGSVQNAKLSLDSSNVRSTVKILGCRRRVN